MKERIFTTKKQGRVLVEAGLPISTASGFRDKYLDQLHSMKDDAGRIGYSKKYDCWVALVYRKGDNYYTNMECDVEYKTSPPDEYEYVYP